MALARHSSGDRRVKPNVIGIKRMRIDSAWSDPCSTIIHEKFVRVGSLVDSRRKLSAKGIDQLNNFRMGHQVLQARGTDHRGAQGREALRNGFGLVVAMSWASARGFELRQGDICVAARGAGGVMTFGWAEGL